MILGCSRCTQCLLSFTEVIDWVNGDDSQDGTLLPLTEAEAADLLQQRESLTESKLETLGSGRRACGGLTKGAVRDIVFWRTGISAGMHD
jgi:hypothetical protein